MKALAALVALLSLCWPASAGNSLTAAATVRQMNMDGKNACSAVAIKPDLAIGARHCISNGVKVIKIDGLVVTKSDVFLGSDAAYFRVPGLQCPCAKVAKLGQEVYGIKIIAIGFPYATMYENPVKVIQNGEL